jgi:hypothetical protein
MLKALCCTLAVLAAIGAVAARRNAGRDRR